MSAGDFIALLHQCGNKAAETKFAVECCFHQCVVIASALMNARKCVKIFRKIIRTIVKRGDIVNVKMCIETQPRDALLNGLLFIFNTPETVILFI